MNIISDCQQLSDDALLNSYATVKQAAQDVADRRGRIEQEIWRRLRQAESEGAQVGSIPSAQYICEDATRPTYDQAALVPLRDLLTQPDLAACFTPEHQETMTVPDKWDMRKVLPLARRSAEVQHVVNRATIPGTPKLRFEERKSP